MMSVVFIISGCALHRTAELSPEVEQMIGQMVMVGFRGLEAGPDSPVVSDIRDAGIGGVVLFSKDCALNSSVRNIAGPEQLQKLTGDLQDHARIPLFIAVDQEGGIISRLTPEAGFPATPSAAELGNSGDLWAAFRAGRTVGRTLGSVGINMDFAPVVDLNRNPVNPVISGLQRSFSDDPEIAAAFAGAFIDGLHSEKIISCIKHFPGHGSSVGDSHKGFTDVTATWVSDELYPFEKLISEGRADMVMTAHIFNEKLDSQYPATLSEKVIGGMLRHDMGFDSVIVTDDLGMGAISSLYGMREAVRRAVDAGADILLFGNNLTYEPALGTRVVDILKDLVGRGEISEARIRRSYERIMRLKAGI